MTQDLEHASDDQLLTAIASGRRDALMWLFRRRHADVHRFALHMSGAPAVADDVTQDVFLIVMRDAARYQAGRSSAVAWLCGIARNCVRQRLEREGRFESLSDSDSEDEGGGDLPAIDSDPLADLSRAEQVALLRRAVLSLPVRYREVVVLCDLEELTYADAADALGCAIGTVRSRLHRARILLAGKLGASRRANVTRPPEPSPPSGPTKAFGIRSGQALNVSAPHKRCLA